MEIVYEYCMCSNCGKYEIQWTVEVVKDEYLCESCLRLIADKIADQKKEEAMKNEHHGGTYYDQEGGEHRDLGEMCGQG